MYVLFSAVISYFQHHWFGGDWDNVDLNCRSEIQGRGWESEESQSHRGQKLQMLLKAKEDQDSVIPPQGLNSKSGSEISTTHILAGSGGAGAVIPFNFKWFEESLASLEEETTHTTLFLTEIAW